MTYTTEAMLATFLSLNNVDQIHVAIARECQTQRGRWRCSHRYSKERLEEHNEWVKSHKGLLEKFNLKGGQI